MYLIYHTMAKLEEPYKANGRTFSASRLDDSTIKDADYRHCTFVDVSFKNTTLQNCQFMH